MKAGRELDALVAEKAMGLKILKIDKEQAIELLNTPSNIPTSEKVEIIYNLLHGSAALDDDILPKYSTDIAAAWEIVETMNRDGWRMEIIKTELGGSTVKFICNVGARGRFQAESNTTAEAICLAALKTAGE